MNTDFLDFFKRFNFLSLEDLRLLYSMVRIKKVSAGDRIINEGEVFFFGVFIIKGLLRVYYIMPNGEDRTLHFAYDGMHLGSPESIFEDMPALENVEALEPSLLLYLDTRKFDKLARNKPALLRLKNSGLEESVVEMAKRVKFLSIYEAEEPGHC